MPFEFPVDSKNRAGAIRVTSGGNNFFVPIVIFGPDGVTPILNALPDDSLISQPSSLQNVKNTNPGVSQIFSQTDSLTAYAKERIIGLYNGGDQPVVIECSPYLKSIGYINSNVSVTLTLPAQSGSYITKSDTDISGPWDSLSLSVNYETLPTNQNGVNVTVAETI